jgi:hypothetical protein
VLLLRLLTFVYRIAQSRTLPLLHHVNFASCSLKVFAGSLAKTFSSNAASGEYVASGRGQRDESLQKPAASDADASTLLHQDSCAMRLFLFDCTDAARISSKIMLRLRRSISALAPDVSLGAITIYSRILASRPPPPLVDVEKVSSIPNSSAPSRHRMSDASGQ